MMVRLTTILLLIWLLVSGMLIWNYAPRVAHEISATDPGYTVSGFNRYHFSALRIYNPGRKWAIAALTAVSFVLLFASVLGHRPREIAFHVRSVPRRWAWFLFLAYIAGSFCFNVFGTPYLTSMKPFAALSHWMMMPGVADRVAAGVPLPEAVPDYGLWWPLIIGWVQEDGMLAASSVLRILMMQDTVFLILFGWAVYRWSRRKWWAWFPVVLVVALSMLRPGGHMIAPNLTMFRLAGFVVTMVSILAFSSRYPAASACSLGAAAAFSFFNNLESGIGCVFGSLVFCLLWSIQKRSAQLILPYLGGAAGILVLLQGLSLLVYGKLQSASFLIQYNSYLGISQHGANQHDIHSNLPYIIMLVMAAAMLGMMVDLIRKTELSLRNTKRAAFIAMSAVWFVYYSNRPDFPALSPMLLVLTPMISDYSRTAVVAWRRQTSLLPIASAFALAGIVLIAPMHASWKYSWSYRTSDAYEMVSGVGVRKPLADDFHAQAAYLLKHGPVCYISTDAFLLARLGGRPIQPIEDLGLMLTVTQYQDTLLRCRDETVLISELMDRDAIWYGGMIEVLRKDLEATHDRHGTSHGWEVWKPKH